MRNENDVLVVGSLAELQKKPSYNFVHKASPDQRYGVATIARPSRSKQSDVRQNRNQDTAAAFMNGCLVADGVGGGLDGARASSNIAQRILARVHHATASAGSMIQAAKESLQRDTRLSVGDGSTVAYARAVQDRVTECDVEVVHSGDSRVYCILPTGTILRTRDHTLVGYLVDGGIETEELVGLFQGVRCHHNTNILILRERIARDFPHIACLIASPLNRRIATLISKLNEKERWAFRRLIVQYCSLLETQYRDYAADVNFNQFPDDAYLGSELGDMLVYCLTPDQTPCHFSQKVLTVSRGTTFFACTDGLSHLLSDDELGQYLRSGDYESLINFAVQRGLNDDTTFAWWYY